MGLVGLDGDFVAGEVEVGHSQIGEFRDTHTSLKEELDDGGDARISAAGVSEGTVLELAEDSGRLQIIFGVTDTCGGIEIDQVLALEEAKEGFDGVELAADGLGGILLPIEISFESVNVLRSN